MIMFSLSLIKNTICKPLWTRNFFLSATVSNQYNKDPIPIDYREITKDRTQEIPVETSIRYLKSTAYKTTYGSEPVWKPYRRNHKGSIPPEKTRKTCIRGGIISTGNPCPICRDEYLVLNEHNVDLLNQFVCPHTGQILSYKITGLCQAKHKQLLIAIKRAYNFGLITFDVPFREYDYSNYYTSQ